MPSTDTVTAKLTPGEFVIKKSAVDILGVPLLRKLNNLPDEGGHDNIDKLLSMAALEDAKPMMGGGVTTPNGVMGYENGGQAFAEPEIRRTNPNLGIDPYMRYKIIEGHPMMDDPLYHKSDALVDRLISGGGEMSDIMPFKERRAFKDYVESGQGNARDEMLLSKLTKAIPVPSRVKQKGKADLANLNFLAKKGYDRMREDILQKEKQPMRNLRKAQQDRDDILFNILDTSSFFNKQHGGMIGYQEGDVVQDDAMMQQYLQQQQMQQQQGQQQPSIAPPGAAAGQTMSWGEPGDYYESLKATRDNLQQAAEQAKIDSANQSLEAIKLDSLIRSLGKEGGAIERKPEGGGFLYNDFEQQEMPARQFSNDRNMTEFLKQQLMQRGEGALKQGMGENLDLMYR